jgi:hypothetical protein
MASMSIGALRGLLGNIGLMGVHALPVSSSA